MVGVGRAKATLRTALSLVCGVALATLLTLPIPAAAESQSGQVESERLSATSAIATPPPITGSPEVDARIRLLAEARGYQPRLPAIGPLSVVDGQLLQPEAAAAWEQLKAAAGAEGHHLRLVAGFRDIDTQRSLFLRRLGGRSDAAVEATLRWSAPPGYSKHHTGYAIDITERGSRAGRFASSAAYAWMAGNDYFNAKRFGFLPSYPPDIVLAGPEPEAWEWLYVGVSQRPKMAALRTAFGAYLD